MGLFTKNDPCVICGGKFKGLNLQVAYDFTLEKWKPVMAMLMAVVMLCSMLPATVIAAGWDDIPDGGLGFHYGVSGFLNITMPTSEGYYTYGTASESTVAETAANVSALPDSGWQWAVKREADGYRMILKDFRVSYGGGTDGLMFDCPLTLELCGSNSLTATSARGSMVSGSYEAANKLTILGSGSLTLTGGMFGFNVDNAINVTGGTVTVSVDWYAIRSGSLELGTAMTAQVSNNADGTNPEAFTGYNATEKYLKIEKAATCTITFDKNGGTGTMEAVTDVLGEYTLPACGFTAPVDKVFKTWNINGSEKAVGDKITVNADTTVTALWQNVEKYNLWIGGVQVTSSNANSITGEGISGTVSYDHASKTLTLDNATITKAYEFNTFWHDTSVIYSTDDLTVKLIGDNTITGAANNGSSYGIHIEDSRLSFSGNGNLTVSSADVSTSKWTVAVFADEDITITEECSITAYCGTNGGITRGIYSYGNFELSSEVIAFGNKTAPNADNIELYSGSYPGSYKYLKVVPGSTVKLNTNGGAINDGNVTFYLKDSGAALPTNVTKSGYTFDGWYDNNECTGTATTAIPSGATGAKEYWAKWTVIHTCNIEPVAKEWSTCENGGKEAYYKCEGCDKYFEDANGASEIADIAAWGNLPKLGHTEGTAWEKDGTHHWHTCTVANCGAVIDSSKAAHTSIGANVATCQKKAVCDICGVTYGDFASHDWNTTSWEKDATGHWHKCNTAGCTEKNAFAAHTPDHQGGATEEYPIKCPVCDWIIEQQLSHTHVFDKEVAEDQYKASGATCTEPAKYYKSCACGEKGTETFENGSANGHTEGTEWKSNKDNHWNECACGDKTNTSAHKDENADGKCDICTYNVGLPTPPADPSNPQTDDNTQLGLWIALLIVSSFSIVAITLFDKKRYSVR